MRKWLPLVAICAGTFMLLVDVTIVTVALPDMARGLNASLADLQWVLSLYALVLASLVLTAGSIADRLGRRAVYLGGLVVFAVASLVCGLSPNVGLLIAARGLQGLAAAAMFATTLALITSSYEGRDRGIAFGVWAAVNGAASAAGPLLGGLLTDSFGWRWIFFVNLPVTAVALVLTALAVPESRDPQPRRLDLAGMASFTVGSAALVYALINESSWLFVVAAAALAVFVFVERRPNAMLDLSLFRTAAFPTLLVTAALLPAAAWAYWIYQTLWLQSVLGLSPIEAGLVFLPVSLTTFVLSIVVGRVMHRTSARLLIGSGMLFIAAGVLAQTVIDAGSGWAALLPGLFLVGVGAGLVLGPLSAAAMAAVPGPRAGMAAGAVNTFRQLGYALGVAVLGQVFRSGLDSDDLHRAYANALDRTFVVAASFAVFAGVAVFLFVRDGQRRGGLVPVRRMVSRWVSPTARS
ncbi:EmrB/QacA subfamily drug resistance transporter [Kribbella antiqua]|uniref:EmrB/QacA subfamily drug resistance transporter n=1 Tax=Kribbella antiqua TaxID=2512217 RepID=A0A4R2J3V8_9ACTN|nr:MFS transporter [Kribbella antiqua]TCO51468.1 EmrB/QacA subfamily drug resistance transporter [Kribbella antiqua]